MAGRITGMVRYGKSLAILTESSIVVTRDNGKEPNEWPREVFSEVGTNGEFVRQFADEFMDLMGATSIFDPERQEVKDALMVLLIEGLLPAYVRLREIRGSTGQHIPILNRRQQFEGFAGELWRAYKALMPRATKLLGYDLGFLFQERPKFNKGIIAFRAAHPSRTNVLDHLLSQKANWQDGLAAFRNFVEHRGATPEKFAEYYKPERADFLFDAVWRTLANIIPIFIASHLNGPLTIEEIPLPERDPNHRRRFRWVPIQGREELIAR
jgi:hypothetical protein